MNTVIILGVATLTSLPLCFSKKISNNFIKTFCKVLAISLFVLGNFRSFLNDNFIWIINGGNYGETFYKTQDVWQSVLRWVTYISFIVYPCAFFCNVRIFKNFALYFCTPVTILASFFYGDFLNYFLTPSGRAIWAVEWLRHVEFSLELILPIVMGVLLRFRLGHKFNVKSGVEWKNFLILLPITIVTTFPVYLPQSLFGFSKLYMSPLSAQHFLWLTLLLVIFAVLYFAFRYKSYDERFAVCLYLALYLFMHYNSIYLMDLKLSRLPFQLCNLGSYLALIALIIRKQAFSNFVLIANVSGTIIALFVPDVKEGMLSFWNIHYYIEHMLVFIVPLLMVTLRLMKRPDKSAIKHYFIGFSIYFSFCAITGTLFNCFLYTPGDFFFNEVNYFYMFDDKITSVLFFVRFTRNFPVTISDYTIYPLYMVMVYTLFSLFCMGCYFLFKYLCKIGDDHFNLRLIRISLYREKHPNSKKKFNEKYLD